MSLVSPTSTNIIPNATKNVNEKFDARENKENVATAKAYFGTTYNIKEAGYLLTDGKLLDFSGKHEGGRGGYRTVDHRRSGKAKWGDAFYDINLEVDVKVPRAKSTSLIKSSTSNGIIPNSNENVNEEIWVLL